MCGRSGGGSNLADGRGLGGVIVGLVGEGAKPIIDLERSWYISVDFSPAVRLIANFWRP